MKTAISLSDDLFDAVERAAARLGLSRSGLFARAVEEYLERNGPQNVTAALNEVYADRAAAVDPVLARMQRATLDDEDW